jgi:hypothetical protein
MFTKALKIRRGLKPAAERKAGELPRAEDKK